ncbi:hypothetical protein [Candidatus Burkholderia verschuerenii]|uniref:hypothetical protein n=1 Tax=Candidatus Burkholderia verschuerenii TaxID=242163 RepID=UPI000AC185FC|nr:hypothetical protein [Candidatus Burkholderia verschuerenii]
MTSKLPRSHGRRFAFVENDVFRFDSGAINRLFCGKGFRCDQFVIQTGDALMPRFIGCNHMID